MKLEEYLQARYRPSTAAAYLRQIRLYLAAVGEEQAQSAGYREITAYIGRLREASATAQSIRNIVFGIKQYYRYLLRSGARADDPCSSLRLRDQVRRDVQLQDLFTRDELRSLLVRQERYGLLARRNRLVMGLLVHQALSTREIAELRVCDIDLSKGKVHLQGTARTNARTLALEAEQIMVIHEYLTHDRPRLLKVATDTLIITKQGRAESGEGISYLVSTCQHLYPKRRLTPQRIRQSVIRNKLQAGADLRAVQVFAGHKYPSSTERYRAGAIEELQAAISRYHPLT